MDSSAGYRISFFKKQRNSEKIIEVINSFIDKQDYLEDWQKDNFKIASSNGKDFDPGDWDLPISIEDYEGFLLELCKEVAASFPKLSFIGKSVITDSGSGWSSFDSVKYEGHEFRYFGISTEEGEDVQCPECGEEQLVHNVEKGTYHCFACDENYTDEDLTFCERCGSLMRHNGEISICQNCVEDMAWE